MRMFVAVVLASSIILPGSAKCDEIPSHQFVLTWTGNLPDAPIGLAFYFTDTPIGIYAAFRGSGTAYAPPDDVLNDDEIATAIGFPNGDLKSKFFVLSLGITHRITPSVAVYGGAGYAWEKHYVGFNGLFIRSEDGRTPTLETGDFLIEDKFQRNNRTSLSAGLVLTNSSNRLAFTVGADSAPGALTLGLGVRF